MRKLIFVLLLYLIGYSCSKKTNFLSSDDINTSSLSKNIVFVSEHGGNSDIYIMDIEGKNIKQLTTNNLEDSHPVFSPTRNEIAYFSVTKGIGGIWIMDIDGNNKKKLYNVSEGLCEPNFTPDGLKVFHISEYGKILNISNTDGTNHRNINISMYPSYYPAYHSYDISPDGTKIIFSSNKFNQNNYDICIMDLNSYNIEKINLPIDSEFDVGPRFSPTGDCFVYYIEIYEQNNGIYLYNLKNHDHKKLTPDSIQNASGPFLTPDGSKIIFTAEASHLYKKMLKPLGNPSLFIMSSDGSNLLELESGNTYSHNVFFSDTTDKFYYIRQNDIYSVDINSLDQEKIIELSDYAWNYSLHENYIYFILESSIYRINTDGTNLTKLTEPIYICKHFDIKL